MKHFFNPDPKDLIQIKANQLKPGDVFYLKNDEGKFERCSVNLADYPTPYKMQCFREWLKKKSEEGRLHFRRDKGGKDFSDMLLV